MTSKTIIKTINILLKEIRKNAISKVHRKADLNLDCPECKFRLLEMCLEWWLDLEEWDSRNKKIKSRK